MKTSEIDLDQFDSIEDLYGFVDVEILNLEKRGDLRDLWVRYRNSAKTEEEREKAQFEIDFLLYYLLDGRFFPLVHGKSGKAEKVCHYPDLSDGGKREFDHLLSRAMNVKNPLLKAKFYHILWQSPSGLRKKEFAEAAIVQYQFAIELLHQEVKSSGDKNLLNLVQQNFENFAAICREIKANRSPITKVLNQLLEDKFKIQFYVKEQLATVVLRYPLLFDRGSVSLCYNAYEDHFWKECRREDPFLIITHYAPNAIKFAQKLKLDPKKWYELIGQLQLEHAKSETDPSRFWRSMKDLLDAQNNLRKGGNRKLHKEAGDLYEKLRPSVELPSVRQTYTRENHEALFSYRDSRVEIAKKLAEEASSEQIYVRLYSGLDFPSAAAFENPGQDFVPDFLKGIQTTFFDFNGNVSTGNDELDEKVMKLNFYQLELNFQTMPFLHTLFTEGIRSGKLTAKNLIEHLVKNTWIGKPYFVQDRKSRDHIKSWVSLLAPSLIDFFAQVHASESSVSYTPSYVLAIDSLVVKIEGLLRFFLYQSGVKTVYPKNKKAEMMTLNQLLESEGFKHYFNEDDQLFFEYLFGGEGGLDIRNNVAHCFYNDENYHVMSGILIICALLRISKYNFNWERNHDTSK